MSICLWPQGTHTCKSTQTTANDWSLRAATHLSLKGKSYLSLTAKDNWLRRCRMMSGKHIKPGHIHRDGRNLFGRIKFLISSLAKLKVNKLMFNSRAGDDGTAWNQTKHTFSGTPWKYKLCVRFTHKYCTCAVHPSILTAAQLYLVTCCYSSCGAHFLIGNIVNNKLLLWQKKERK